MKANRLILIAILVVATLPLNAQDKITYVYDQSGNRTEKVLTIGGQKKSQASDEESENREEIEEKIGDATIKLYPNPTAGRITIASDQVENYSSMRIKVFDQSSRLILIQEVQNYPVDLDLTKHPSGTYFLLIEFKKNISRWKVIKL